MPIVLSGDIEPRSPRVTVSRSIAGLLARALRWLAVIVAVLLVGVVLLMLLYRFVAPPTTPTLAWRSLMGRPIDRQWIALDDVSPRLIEAVIASEDARFCQHRGIDFRQLRAAIEESRDGYARGASTITMQVVKNVFLWRDRSYLRKAIELPLSLVLDFVMPKSRILEIYLNVAEWAPGIYGVEAAAWYHFNRSAARLTSTEAARLAVTLPAPSLRDPSAPRAHHQRLAEIVAARVRAGVDTSCILR